MGQFLPDIAGSKVDDNVKGNVPGLAVPIKGMHGQDIGLRQYIGPHRLFQGPQVVFFGVDSVKTNIQLNAILL